MQTLSRKPGFTLVELLVVIAIIGTLMGLLLPAVQSAREAGRRNTCMNNLSQLGKAIISYDGSKGVVPGWRTKGLSTTNPANYSWPVALLPNIERRDIYLAMSGTSAPTAAMTPQIELYLCPSSPPVDSAQSYIAYGGNCGNSPYAAAQSRGDGVMFDQASALAVNVSLDYVSSADGTATTVLLSEKCGSKTTMAEWATVMSSSSTSPTVIWNTASAALPGTFSAGASIPATLQVPAFVHPSSNLTNTQQMVNQPVDASTAAGSVAANNLVRGITSNHPGGALAVFCDGHVVFLKDGLVDNVYSQLLTSNREQVSGSPAVPGAFDAVYSIIRDTDFQ